LYFYGAGIFSKAYGICPEDLDEIISIEKSYRNINAVATL